MTTSRIVTLTPNPALDVTYRVDALIPGSTHRVRQVVERAGGKGVNVARVLASWGHPVEVVGPLGGDTGARMAAELAAAALPHTTVPIGEPTRRSVAVVDPKGVSLFNEPGPRLTESEWLALIEVVGERVAGAAALVVSGSLPPGAPNDFMARLVAAATGAGARVIVDTSGPALQAAAEAGADLLKPNADEAAAMTDRNDPWSGAAELVSAGARRVVVSLGADGLAAVDADGVAWRVVVPRVDGGNPTGAGDAVVAALARSGAETGLRGGAWTSTWSDTLAEAAAWGASAVTMATAGEVDPTTYQTVLSQTTVERIHAPDSPH